mmetsp:Transcript_2232/g.7958  ORF Transcript_2232/g.7958 Transcript_2232/m.7958 type:complete len:272 (+) Transcript_2232:286-1101(+)
MAGHCLGKNRRERRRAARGRQLPPWRRVRHSRPPPAPAGAQLPRERAIAVGCRSPPPPLPRGLLCGRSGPRTARWRQRGRRAAAGRGPAHVGAALAAAAVRRRRRAGRRAAGRASSSRPSTGPPPALPSGRSPRQRRRPRQRPSVAAAHASAAPPRATGARLAPATHRTPPPLQRIRWPRVRRGRPAGVRLRCLRISARAPVRTLPRAPPEPLPPPQPGPPPLRRRRPRRAGAALPPWSVSAATPPQESRRRRCPSPWSPCGASARESSPP